MDKWTHTPHQVGWPKCQRCRMLRTGRLKYLTEEERKRAEETRRDDRKDEKR